ncbi:hypothetical protein ACJW8F_16485 [Plesiomonas shigelloides]|uniref:hypothetical protein n=1 Tax=Plesiomonas shigelloides TaxID=703 RepID=UPI00387EEBA4
MFQIIFNFFNQGWVGSLIGIIGIVLGVVGIFSFKVARSTAKPVYQKSSLKLLGRQEDNLPPEVCVTYKGLEVQRLTKVSIVIWNKGTEVLDGDCIVEADPITLNFPSGSQILSYKLLKVSKETNGCSIEQLSDSCLKFDFKYLDPSDGATIELLHDSEQVYPDFQGTMKGIPRGIEDLGRVFTPRKSSLKFPFNVLIGNHKLFFWFTMLIGLVMAAGSFIPSLSMFSKDTPENVDGLMLIFGIIYALVPAFALLHGRSKYPKSLEFQEIEP